MKQIKRLFFSSKVILPKYFFFSAVPQRKSGLDRLIVEFATRKSQTDTRMRYDSSERVIKTLRRPLPTQLTTNPREWHSCCQRDSNFRSVVTILSGSVIWRVLRAFAMLREKTMCSVMSTCPPFLPAVCWRGKTRLSLDKVLIKFCIGYLLISLNKLQFCSRWDKITSNLH